MRERGIPSENPEDRKRERVKVGDYIMGSGTTTTQGEKGQGVLCEVLEVKRNGAVRVKVMGGKYIGSETELLKEDCMPTGENVAKDIEKNERNEAEEMKIEKALHKGAKVGDIVIASGTTATKDGVRARIVSMGEDEKIEATILEGEFQGNTVGLFGCDWKKEDK